MPTGRQTKQSIIGGLRALGVEFKEDASYSELLALLKFSQSAKVEERLQPSEEIVEERLQPPMPAPTEVNTEDYLRKYQYRKQTQLGSKDSDPPAGSKAERMKLFLLSQPRVRIFVPRPAGEDNTVLQSVTLNGYRLDFPKATYVELPLQIADVLSESLKQTEEAIGRMRVDSNRSKGGITHQSALT